MAHNSLGTHRTLQTALALSPESSVTGFSRPVSVQNSAAVFNGENSIYADPEFDYQEQCVPECELTTTTEIRNSHDRL